MLATDTLLNRDTFLTALRTSELVTEKQFGRALLELSPFARTAREVANHFQKLELLTRFQAERLLSGRTEGFQIGPYLILDYLGKSATGRMYKARHRTMNRLVAIKILALEQTATEEIRAEIRTEARSVARLAHSNIVTLLDANQAGERMYFVKEYLDGGSLDTLVRTNGPLSVRRACEFIRQAALGLQHAHEMGVVHRRLSPTAILVGRVGGVGSDDKPLVKVSGFGLDCLGSDGEEVDSSYRAPEQLANPADASSDLYSLGCVLHFLLTGQPPFPATVFHRDTPTPLANFILQLLDPNPLARPASAEVVARFLQIYADSDDGGGVVDFSLPTGSLEGTASMIGHSLPGVLADLPHRPLLNVDDPEQPTVRTGHDMTPVSLPKRTIRRLRRPKSVAPKFESRWTFGAIVAGVGFGLLLAIFCIVKFWATAKG